MSNHNNHFHRNLTQAQAEQVLQLQSAPQWAALETFLIQLMEQYRTDLETLPVDRTQITQGKCQGIREVLSVFERIRAHN